MEGTGCIGALGSAAIAVSLAATDVVAGGASFATWRGDPSLTGVIKDRIPDFPVRVWAFPAGAAVPFTPVVGDGMVFFVTRNSQIFALDMNGAKVWSKGIEPRPVHPPVPPQPMEITAPPAYAFGTLVVASSQGGVYAFDGKDGHEKWSASVGARVQGTPSFVDLGKDGFLVVVIAQAKGAISAFDGATGIRKWLHDRSARDRPPTDRDVVDGNPENPGQPVPAPGVPARDGADPSGPGRSSPRYRVDGHIAVLGTRIAYGGCDATIHVLSATNGESLFSVALGRESEVAGGVAFAGKMVYSGCRRGVLCAVDTEDKTLKWSFGAGTGQLFTTPTATDKIVVFSAENGTVTAVDVSDTTRPKWISEILGMHAESPIVVGERVVVVVDGKVYILDLNDGKKVLWTSPSVGDCATAPAVAGGMVIVGSDSGSVVAFGAPPAAGKGETK